MTIETADALIKALANNNSRVVVNKTSISNQTSGRFCSLWRATGTPGQAALPTAATACTSALLGAMPFANQVAPLTSYLTWLTLASSSAFTTYEVHDRLAHTGGLSFNLTTAQAISGMDLSTLAPSADRVGDANWSDIQWWVEVYADSGGTASNATINVTYNDGTTGDLNVLALSGISRAGNLFALTPLIPSAQQGKFIRGINSITLSAATGSVGNFGFTATRLRSAVSMDMTNLSKVSDWQALGMPRIANDACLMLMVLCTSTATGTLLGSGKISHG